MADFKATAAATVQCATFFLIGLIIDSDSMTAGGLLALVVCVPVAVVVDWCRRKRPVRIDAFLLPPG